jgi:hypothetical protein
MKEDAPEVTSKESDTSMLQSSLTMNVPSEAAAQQQDSVISFPNEEDVSICPICSEPMCAEDTIYPLLCETAVCHFNMCSSCSEKLLEASHQGLQVASDGNLFSTKLQCPSCRGAFLVRLDDILILREYNIQERLKSVKDSELNAKELRQKYYFADDNFNEIERAKDCYLRATMKRSGIQEDDICLYMSKLDTKPVQTESDLAAISDRNKKIRYIDDMLLCGLEESMSEGERDFIVQLMTSGFTDKLVQAVKLRASIIQMNSQKRKLQSKLNHGTSTGYQPLRPIRTPTALEISSHKRPSQPYIRPQSPNYSYRMSSASLLTNKRSVPSSSEIEARQRLKWSSSYPLPFRMPNAIKISLDFDPFDTKQCPIRFIDDEETLSFLKYDEKYSTMSYENRCQLVRDAYSTFFITSRGKLIKKDGSRFYGAENILQQLEHNVEDRPAPDTAVPWRRVFVSFVHGKLQCKTGLRVGDVVTHLDGEPLDGNADKLRFLLLQKQREETIGGEAPTVELVTNAEVSIVEALRLRTLAAKNQHDD